MLMHNPYLPDCARIANRSDATTENVAVEWAKNGLIKIQHVLARNGKRILTPTEFINQWPDLRDSLWAYSELHANIPKTWIDTLATGNNAAAPNTWYAMPDGTIRCQYTDEDGKPVEQQYERECDTNRISKLNEMTRRSNPRVFAAATTCCVRRTTKAPNACASWTDGTPADLREARRQHLEYEIVSECLDTCHQPLDDLCLQPAGITKRHPTRVSTLKQSHMRDMLTTQTAILPRAWDPRDPHEHFAHLYAELTPMEYTATMRRIFKLARHHDIPPYMQDVLYKNLVSGHHIGPHKRRGIEALCACGQPETLEHAYALCQTVQTLWGMIINRWNAATNQSLDSTDLRVTLLGDRGTQQHAITEHLWNLTHAATIWVIHKTAKTRRENREKTVSAAAMLTSTRQTLQRLITAAWINKTPGEHDTWSAWRTERWVTIRNQRAHAQILMGGFTHGVDNATNAQPHHARCHRCAPSCASATEATDTTDAQPNAPHNFDQPVVQNPPRPHAPRPRGCPSAPSASSVRPQNITTSRDPPAVNLQQTRQIDQPIARLTNCTCKPRPTRSMHIYTDGAWTPAQEDQPPTAAGYGAVELTELSHAEARTNNATNVTSARDKRALIPVAQLTTDGTDADPRVCHITWTQSGTVQTATAKSDYIGAKAHTNNTGELTAMHVALTRALATIDTTTHITIHTDSLYAMNMTTGTWMPRAKNRRNACLARRMRILWRQVQRKAPGATNIAHVRSHTGVPGNEIADWMADQGQHSDDSISIPDASRWAVRWLDQRPPPRPSAPRTRDPAAARTPHAPQAMPRPPPPQRGASSPEFPAAAVT